MTDRPKAEPADVGRSAAATPVAGDRPGRLLGVDLGERRIGLALADAATGAASPLTTIRRARSVELDARLLGRIAREQRAGILVVGLPRNMDGSEGGQAERTRAWGEAIAALTGLPLRFRDERLTSERAEQRLERPARGRSGGPPTAGQREAHRARIDREAAALILQDELDAGGPADATGQEPEPAVAGRGRR